MKMPGHVDADPVDLVLDSPDGESRGILFRTGDLSRSTRFGTSSPAPTSSPPRRDRGASGS
jgi:hypothetical protein